MPAEERNLAEVESIQVPPYQCPISAQDLNILLENFDANKVTLRNLENEYRFVLNYVKTCI